MNHASVVAPESLREGQLFRAAMFWAVFGVMYNLVEGAVSTWLGAEEETLALFGFGVDSFIEAISAVGIAMMIVRIRRSPDQPRAAFESLALRITGGCFYLLAIGLTAGAALNWYRGARPETTIPGVVIALISISVMWIMLRAKLRIGRELGSKAMTADAKCTQVCIWMSFVLLASSALYALLGFGWIDAVGSLAIAYFCHREGKEAFEHASGKETCCGEHCH